MRLDETIGGSTSPVTPDSVTTAQCRAFARKMPSFLGALAVTLLAASYGFHGAAPVILTTVVPAGAAVLALARAVWWYNRRNDRPSEETAKRHLRRATIVQVVLSLGLGIWTIAMSAYVTSDVQQALILMYTTCLMCSFYCLMHLRGAVVIVSILAMAPLIGLLLWQGQTLSYVVALNLAAVFGSVIVATLFYNADFTRLALMNIELKGQKERVQTLSNENLRLANLDMLTGLANRRRLFDELESIAAAHRNGGRPVTLGIVDLDGFKPINDTLGHSLGDHVLREIADRLSEHFGDEIAVYRLGGDEFAIIVREDLDDARLVELGDRTIAVARLPIHVGSLVTSVGCSVGFARMDTSGLSATMLYERADFALYHAKRSGRGRTVLFSKEHENIIGEQGRIEQALRCADLEAEFYLEFQPIVNAPTGRVLALEALARWTSPTLGPISPGKFIPIAERAGLVGMLTPVLLLRALRTASTWPEDVRLSFNLSAHDIASPECTMRILAILSSEGFDPRRIDFEITETALANDFEAAKQHLELLKSTGAQIALDDFGTGFSSLSRVNALPLDKIKVDRSFVTQLGDKDSSRKIVSSVAALCRDMDLGCVIEGVETEDQQRILSDLGAEVLQGYLFSKPLPADRLHAFIEGAESRRAVVGA